MTKWKDVVGYEGLYQVSNTGLVRSLDREVPHGKYGGTRRLRGRVLRGSPNNYGLLMVSLSKDGVQPKVPIHQIVAAAWLGPKPEGTIIRHGSGGSLDNSIENLCYGSKSDDLLAKPRNGTLVRRSDGKEYKSLSEAARDSNCDASNILKVCNGLRSTTEDPDGGDFEWEFFDNEEYIDD